MITPMSRIELICLNAVRSSVVESLQAKGLLHLDEVSTEIEEAPGYLSRIHLEGDELVRYTKFEEVDRTLSEVVPLLSIEPSTYDIQAEASKIESATAEELAAQIASGAAQLRDVVRRRAETQDQIDVLTNYRTILEEVAPALGSNVKIGQGAKAIVLTGNVSRAATNLERRLKDEIADQFTFHRTQTSRRHLVGLITFPPDRDNEVSRILSQEGVSPIDMRNDEFPDATIGEVLERVKTSLESHRKTLGELEGETNKVSREHGAKLTAARGLVRDTLARYRAQGQFATSEMLTVIQGWTPTNRVDTLRKTIAEEFAGRVDLNSVEHGEGGRDAIPTLLDNPKLFKPFEVVLKIFKPPAYGTVDPTIMVALSFILFYGFIVGDFVYGLVIILFAKWLGAKWKHIPEVQDASKIGVYMGISSMVFGILYGEYAGEIFGIPHLWFHRGHEKIQLLLYALYLGIAHVLIAISLGVWENYKHGHIGHALEKFGMLLGVLALIIISFGFFGVAPFNAQPMLILAGVMLVVGSVLIIKTLGPMMGPVGVLEIMSLGGNIISYARLMALGVAAIAIADIANGLPAAFGPWLGIPAAILVHLLNIGISMASPTIHALRLNFVEFLPKFYAPEGRGFNPFRKETQW